MRNTASLPCFVRTGFFVLFTLENLKDFYARKRLYCLHHKKFLSCMYFSVKLTCAANTKSTCTTTIICSTLIRTFFTEIISFIRLSNSFSITIWINLKYKMYWVWRENLYTLGMGRASFFLARAEPSQNKLLKILARAELSQRIFLWFFMAQLVHEFFFCQIWKNIEFYVAKFAKKYFI